MARLCWLVFTLLLAFLAVQVNATNMANAIVSNDFNRIDKLLNQGENIGAAMQLAINLNRPVIVRHLLDRGADVEGDMDRNPLEQAILVHSLVIVEMLIERGANVDRNVPLVLAAMLGNMGIVELLVSRGALIDLTNDEGKNALHKAAEAGHLDICHFLLDCKADPSLTDRNGNTALMLAALNRRPCIVSYLLQSNNPSVDINYLSNDGSSALILACSVRDLLSVQMLLAHGADVNLTNLNGDTALLITLIDQLSEALALFLPHGAGAIRAHYALDFEADNEMKRLEIVRLLVDAGADIDKMNRSGQSTRSITLVNCRQRSFYRKVAEIIKLHC